MDYFLPSAYLGSMKKLKFLFFPTILALAFGLMLSCAKSSSDDSSSSADTSSSEETNTSSAVTLSGKVQKGPYVQGTEITVRELDSSMTPTLVTPSQAPSMTIQVVSASKEPLQTK